MNSFGKEFELRKRMVNEISNSSIDPLHIRTGWEQAMRIYLSAWILEPYIFHERINALLEVFNAEEATVGGSSGNRRRTL